MAGSSWLGTAQMKTDRHLLLLDLDGVLVTTYSESDPAGSEILRLHADAGDRLRRLGEPYAVVTHRPRSEAGPILRALDIDSDLFLACFCANDITKSMVFSGRWWSAFRSGLIKSRVLPLIYRRLGFHPRRLALIDDRSENLADMSANGVGLTMLSPAPAVTKSHDIVGFDFSQALDVFEKWCEQDAGALRQSCRPDVVAEEHILELPQVHVHLGSWASSGVFLGQQPHNLFSRVRGVARRLRRRLRPGM